VVYCAPNPATSLVELLVHIEIDSADLADSLQYLEIEAPDRISMATANVDALGRNWQGNQEVTRHAGDEWLRAGKTALFRVPSVVVPATWNVLINPRHADSLPIRIARIHHHGVDVRLPR
jgi:RES domain-containing protein